MHVDIGAYSLKYGLTKSMFIYMYTVMMTYHAQVPFVLYSYKGTCIFIVYRFREDFLCMSFTHRTPHNKQYNNK